MSDLFLDSENLTTVNSPLADRLRPNILSEVVRQNHLISSSNLLDNYLQSDKIPSMILRGPPGCGKTTITRIIAENSGGYFEQLSAQTKRLILRR